MRAFWLATWFIAAGALPLAAESPPRLLVRELGDVSKIVIEGAVAFSPEAIREGLARDFEITVATHPRALFSVLPAVITRRLTTAYYEKGFGRVKVDTQLVDDKLVVRIEEGPRFKWGAIQISAPPEVDVEALRAWILHPPKSPDLPRIALKPDKGAITIIPEDQSIPWQTKGDAEFGPVVNHYYTGTVRQGLMDQGWILPLFHVDVVPGDTAEAILKVDVVSVREKPLLERIEVLGLSQMSRDELLDFVGLRDGAILEPKLAQAMLKKLDDSRHFLHREITLRPGRIRANPFTLTIAVREVIGGPKIGGSLSREEQACLKFGEWLNVWKDGHDDLKFTGSLRGLGLPSMPVPMEAAHGEFIFSPGRGVYARVRCEDQAASTWEQICVLQPDRLVAASRPRGQFWETRSAPGTRLLLSDFRIGANLAITGCDLSHKESLSYGFAVPFKSTADLSFPIDVGFSVSPVAGLVWAHFKDAQYTFENDILTVKNGNDVLRIDERTGRPLDCSYGDENGRVFIQVAPGLFDAEVQSFEKSCATLKNVFDARHPVASLVEYLAPDLIQLQILPQPSLSADELRLALKVLRRPLGQLDGLLSVWKQQQLQEHERSQRKDCFNIPPDLSKPSAVGFAYQIGKNISSQLYPDADWPGIATREFLFLMMQETRFTQMHTDEILASYHTGPLGCLCAGTLLGYFLHDKSIPQLGRRGQTRLEDKYFRRDLEVLLQGDTLLSRCASDLAISLRECTPDELNMLGRMLSPGEKAAEVGRILQAFHTNTQAEPNEVLLQTLTELWPLVLREPVRERLVQLTKRYAVEPSEKATTKEKKKDEDPLKWVYEGL